MDLCGDGPIVIQLELALGVKSLDINGAAMYSSQIIYPLFYSSDDLLFPF